MPQSPLSYAECKWLLYGWLSYVALSHFAN